MVTGDGKFQNLPSFSYVIHMPLYARVYIFIFFIFLSLEVSK